LVLLGVILLASDVALSIWASPSITPAFGRKVEVAALVAVGFLGGCAVLLGGYRLIRSRDGRNPPAVPDRTAPGAPG
jgi:hypothetical protein